MSRMRKWTVSLSALFLMTNGAFYAVLADHDEGKESKWYYKIFDRDGDDNDNEEEHYKGYRKRYLTPVNNSKYEEQCGDCHFAYQPELLPSGS